IPRRRIASIVKHPDGCAARTRVCREGPESQGKPIRCDSAAIPHLPVDWKLAGESLRFHHSACGREDPKNDVSLSDRATVNINQILNLTAFADNEDVAVRKIHPVGDADVLISGDA